MNCPYIYTQDYITSQGQADRMFQLLISAARCRRGHRLCLVRHWLAAHVEVAADAEWAAVHLARQVQPAVGPWCRRARTRRRGWRAGRRGHAAPSHGCGRNRRRDASVRPVRRRDDSSARPAEQSADVSPSLSAPTLSASTNTADCCHTLSRVLCYRRFNHSLTFTNNLQHISAFRFGTPQLELQPCSLQQQNICSTSPSFRNLICAMPYSNFNLVSLLSSYGII